LTKFIYTEQTVWIDASEIEEDYRGKPSQQTCHISYRWSLGNR